MRRGVSPIIATVLLVILTLVAVGILAAFVIPFVNNSFKDSKECFDVLGKVKFESESLYGCYAQNTTASGEWRTGFSVRVDSEKVLGLKASFTRTGTTVSHSIENATISNEIRMLNAPFNDKLNVPQRGGMLTYVINGSYESVEIRPILKSGTICDDAHEKLAVQTCADPSITSQLLQY